MFDKLFSDPAVQQAIYHKLCDDTHIDTVAPVRFANIPVRLDRSMPRDEIRVEDGYQRVTIRLR